MRRRRPSCTPRRTLARPDQPRKGHRARYVRVRRNPFEVRRAAVPRNLEGLRRIVQAA
jgi:hypothetical protein